MAADNIFGVHSQAVVLRGQRAEILARNMANADTPGYKARDVDFKQIIGRESALTSSIRTTNKRHISSNEGSVSHATLKYRNPLQPSLDGNTVDLQTERSEFMRNALQYQAFLRFLNGKINGLMTAIRGE